MKQTRWILLALVLTLPLSLSLARPAVADPAQTPPRVASDGPRFRGGIAVSGGLESVSVVSGPMVGIDGRLGVQVNDWLAFYAQPHLSFGSLSGDAGGIGIRGATGTLAVAGLAEITLIDRFFAGAGFGYAVLNNPSGTMFQARLGGYPVMGRKHGGIRRRGLMIGADLRTVFVKGETGLLVLGSVGYEAF